MVDQAERQNPGRRPFAVIPQDGSNIYSWSTFDLGEIPNSGPATDEDVLRKELGDIAFVGQFDRRGNLEDLFFVPEFPEQLFGNLAPVMGYHGVLLSEYGHNSPYEIKAWDSSLRPVDWRKGVEFVKGLDLERCSDLQRRMVESILEIDDRSKAMSPNLDHAEMRRRIGTSLGARVCSTGIMMGYARNPAPRPG